MTKRSACGNVLLKGRFLMVDDFHGTQDWEDFMTGMRQIFPDAAKYPVEDLNDKDEDLPRAVPVHGRSLPGTQPSST